MEAGSAGFYTMKMVRGVSLEEILFLMKSEPGTASKKYSLDVLLIIFQKICDGVAFAHSREEGFTGISSRRTSWWGSLAKSRHGPGLASVVARLGRAGPRRPSDAYADASRPSTLAGRRWGLPFIWLRASDIETPGIVLDDRSDVTRSKPILYEIIALAAARRR